MSEFIQFDFATANTTNSSIATPEPAHNEQSGFESLPRIEPLANSMGARHNGSNMRTAFGTSKARNKFEILRKQSIQSFNRMSSRLDDEASRVLAWDAPGPSLSVR